ncbi:rRNA biogenesis protein rrp36 [Coemansia nantahalensis]|nr:rRNA biogenesis protein rrp36 [Coemansia nantahalensis]
MAKKFEQYSSDEDSSDASDAELLQDDNSSSEGGSGSDSEPEESANEREAERARQLENMPFDQLIRMRQKQAAGQAKPALGAKDRARVRAEAKRALRRQLGKESESSDEAGNGTGHASDSGEEDSDDSGPEEAVATGGSSARQHTDKTADLHRASRKMPTMMSSKRPVGRFRQVVDMPQGRTRDPRFDSLSGHLNEDLFEKSYAFLDDQRKQEMGELKKQARVLKSKSPAEAARAQRALETMQSQEAARQQKKRVQELKRKHRKMETEAVKQGKKPYFLGQRELKELEAAQKFGSLTGPKLDKFLEKRRKRNAAKDHRRMPYQRRDE